VTLAQDAGSPAAPGPQARIGRAARQDKPWGHEMIFAAHEGKYIGKIIYVTAGQSLSLQYHTEKEETISVLSGQALVQHGPVGGELTEQLFGPGDTIDIPAGVVHRVTAVADLTFVEASTAPPGWREDVVRLQDAYGRSGTNAP
jgi:quercetin dioxygenase-like cupin family protein